MKQLLTALFIITAISATAQTKDSSKAEKLMYHYNSLYKALEDSQCVHKNNIVIRTQFLIEQKRYNDSVKKYADIYLQELDNKLDSLYKKRLSY